MQGTFLDKFLSYEKGRNVLIYGLLLHSFLTVNAVNGNYFKSTA